MSGQMSGQTERSPMLREAGTGYIPSGHYFLIPEIGHAIPRMNRPKNSMDSKPIAATFPFQKFTEHVQK
jgi:hypothetical protein